LLLLPLLLLLQSPTEHALLEVEYSRAEDVSTLLRGLRSPEPRLQRLAIRALGRLERASLRDPVVPFVRSADPEVRREAVAALAQMGAPFDFASLLSSEESGAVRAVVYESMGRARPPAPGAEAALVAGLRDDDVTARTGAARGLEARVRLNLKVAPPQPVTLEALRQAVRDNRVSRLRQFALLALNAAGDQDPGAFDIALEDPDPQVRRLAVIGSKRWVEDPSPLVRFEAIRLAATCERALSATRDPSGHVALAAVDALGALKCDPSAVVALVENGASWRIKAHALVSLAKTAPDLARSKLPTFRDDPLWQVRAYAANAASLLNDQATLNALAVDANPNVAAAALTTFDQALLSLARDHAGLLLAAAAKLKGTPGLKSAGPTIVAAIQRLSKEGRATARDARVALIELLREASDAAAIAPLRPLLRDRDPRVASLVAKLLTERTGETVEPATTRYLPEPFPTEAKLRSLRGARATVIMRGLGSFTLELLPAEAPATVAAFVDLAEKGSYDRLTIHRVVQNFVLQGGSPGADEYDPLTSQFMRDELGFTGNERGTLGISTRGHDTGDGQIFINLVDNWRLDHTYTVFARVIEGMEVVDRILEGDVMESVRIRRSGIPAGHSTDRPEQGSNTRWDRAEDE
jgi:cyclophilin family peptidyl-prolyl cis-trans isomerase/HEAT repeat protein